MVECTRLEIWRTVLPYREFESHPLRQLEKAPFFYRALFYFGEEEQANGYGIFPLTDIVDLLSVTFRGLPVINWHPQFLALDT